MKRLIKFLLGLAAGATVAALVTPKSGREMREQLLAGVSGRLLPSSQEPQTLLEEPKPAAAPVAVAEPEAVEPGPELVSESGAEPVPWFRPVPAPAADEAPPAEEPAAEEPVAAEPAAEGPVAEEPAIEGPFAAEPVAEEPSLLAASTYVEAPVADDAAVGVWPVEQETVSSEPEGSAWNAGVAAAVETPLYAEPPLEEAVEPPAAEVEDLRPRIEETRAAVESEIAQPFAPVEEPAAESEITQEIAPVAEEPVAEEPVAEEPVVPEVAAWEEPRSPEVAEPVAEEPAPWEAPPVAEEPVTEAAVPPPLAPSPFGGTAATEAYAAPPTYEAPEEPAVEEAPPLVEEPASAWEAYEEPAPETSAGAWAPETSGLVADTAEVSPVAAEPAVEEPVAAEPVVEEPAVEEPVAAEPVVEEPAAAEPAVEEPAAEEPAEGHAIDQAEMRRRIEETRARLKAKAFDAMMSGEAALLSRDSGEKPVPDGTVQLDSEASAQVDEGLSPDDS